MATKTCTCGVTLPIADLLAVWPTNITPCLPALSLLSTQAAETGRRATGCSTGNTSQRRTISRYFVNECGIIITRSGLVDAPRHRPLLNAT
jgi:hypothetical protein